jgi:hypothetical protein
MFVLNKTKWKNWKEDGKLKHLTSGRKSRK